VKLATYIAVVGALDAAERNLLRAMQLAGHNVKEASHRLPEQKLRVYKGVLEDWCPWWEEFDAAVHSKKNIPNIVKYNYLKTATADGGTGQDRDKQSKVFVVAKKFMKRPSICYGND
jgi:hypothetical protein